MTRINPIAVALFVLALLPPSVSIRACSFADERSAKPESDWQRLALTDEEFSILTPIQPSMLIHSAGYTLSDGGERVLEQRSYSGYADGFIFVVESYKASRPQRLVKDIDHMFDQLKFIERLKLNGFDGKKYEMGRNNFIGNAYIFVTSQHGYTLTVAAKNPNHPHFGRFVSSFTLGDNKTVAGTINPKREDASVLSGAYSGKTIPPKEVTVRAIVVWKPEPSYTQAARYDQRMGTVVLRAVFTASGEVVVSEIIKRLNDGLTEKAIEAAKNVRFFPAEKDGQPISMTIQLEYNFNLY
jgi:TonB family protein